MSVVHYYTVSSKRDSINSKLNRPKSDELIVMGSLLLIGGWLADAYFGRYRVICWGLWIMWIGALLSALSLMISKFNATYEEKDKWVSLFSKLIMGLGFGLFQSNIIQFGIDQLSEASSTEITSFITCYILSFFASAVTVYYSSNHYCSKDYAAVLVLAICLSLALCIYFLFNHLLIKEQIVQNPLPLIWNVVLYTVKNNHLRRRFSHFEGCSCLSRLDIAKTIYTGPFRSEQVEDVKTFIRVLGVIVSCIFAHTGIAGVSSVKSRMLPHFLHWPPNALASISDCYKTVSIEHVSFTFIVVAVLLHQIIVQPVFYNCIPKFTIPSKLFIALILYFVRIMALLGIETASYQYQVTANDSNVDHCYIQMKDNRAVNVNVYWIILPEILNGSSIFILLLATMEFVCAQAPVNMKGLVFGLSYSIFGLGTLIQTLILLPFLYYSKETVWEKAPLTCSIWYFLLQLVIVLVGFVVMIVVIRKYKNRTRVDITHDDDYQVSDN